MQVVVLMVQRVQGLWGSSKKMVVLMVLMVQRVQGLWGSWRRWCKIVQGFRLSEEEEVQMEQKGADGAYGADGAHLQ